MRGLRHDEPRQIGGYRLVGVIGAGGMGRVFLAIAPDGRLAAVKQVHSQLLDEPGFRARFVAEVEASRAVSGAYTAAVLDADPHTDSPWLASVFVAAPSLQDAVLGAGPMPEPAVRRLAAGVAAALHDIHRVGLVHRDVKPANVLLAEDGPRVVDFGIARAGGTGGLTGTGNVLGTLGYLAPEQLDGRAAGPPADVFALGAVLTFAASGRAAFGAEQPQAQLYRIAFGEPDLDRVPPGLHPMLTAFLAKRPEQRPTPLQILQGIGPLEPGPGWLPDRVRSMIHDRGTAAHQLAGARPTGAAGAPAHPTGPATRSAHYGIPAPGTPPPGTYPPGTYRPGTPPPGATGTAPRRRRWVWALAAAALVVALAVAGTLLVVLRGDDTLSPEDAAALVTGVVPAADAPPPAGFAVADNDTTPDVDGAPTDDPVGAVNHTVAQFACDLQADPPVPAETGILATTGIDYDENVGQLPDRLREHLFLDVHYLDAAHRGALIGDLRQRIGGCRTAVPVGFTEWDFSTIAVPGVDEQVAWEAVLPLSDAFPEFPPQVGTCAIVRVEAVAIRGCALISSPPGALDPRISAATDAQALVRTLIDPVVARARQLQSDT